METSDITQLTGDGKKRIFVDFEAKENHSGQTTNTKNLTLI
jgi:hypothetical protein